MYLQSLSHYICFCVFGGCIKKIISNFLVTFLNSPICYRILSFSLNVSAKNSLAVMYSRKFSLYLSQRETAFKIMTTDLKWALSTAWQSSHIFSVNSLPQIPKRPHCTFSLLQTSINPHLTNAFHLGPLHINRRKQSDTVSPSFPLWMYQGLRPYSLPPQHITQGRRVPDATKASSSTTAGTSAFCPCPISDSYITIQQRLAKYRLNE